MDNLDALGNPTLAEVQNPALWTEVPVGVINNNNKNGNLEDNKFYIMIENNEMHKVQVEEKTDDKIAHQAGLGYDIDEYILYQDFADRNNGGQWENNNPPLPQRVLFEWNDGERFYKKVDDNAMVMDGGRRRKARKARKTKKSKKSRRASRRSASRR